MSLFTAGKGKDAEIKRKLGIFEKILSDDTKSKESMLDDLVNILSDLDLNSEDLMAYSLKIHKLSKEKSFEGKIKDFEKIDTELLGRDKALDEFEILLRNSDFDSEDAVKIASARKVRYITKYIIGILCVLFGLAIIILPAPPNFELFTIFYFSNLEGVGLDTQSLGLNEHGITLMDVLAMIIVFSGIFVIVSTGKKNIA